jgi:hypothetical protein
MVHTVVASTSRRRKKSTSYVCPIQLQENLSGIESEIYVGPKCKCGVSTQLDSTQTVEVQDNKTSKHHPTGFEHPWDNVVSQLKPWKYKTTRHRNIIQRVLNILGTMWCLNSTQTVEVQDNKTSKHHPTGFEHPWDNVVSQLNSNRGSTRQQDVETSSNGF